MLIGIALIGAVALSLTLLLSHPPEPVTSPVSPWDKYLHSVELFTIVALAVSVAIVVSACWLTLSSGDGASRSRHKPKHLDTPKP